MVLIFCSFFFCDWLGEQWGITLEGDAVNQKIENISIAEYYLFSCWEKKNQWWWCSSEQLEGASMIEAHQ